MQYKFEKTIKLSNAIANIYRPILTEEERKRRYKQIHNAAANLLKGYKK